MSICLKKNCNEQACIIGNLRKKHKRTFELSRILYLDECNILTSVEKVLTYRLITIEFLNLYLKHFLFKLLLWFYWQFNQSPTIITIPYTGVTQCRKFGWQTIFIFSLRIDTGIPSARWWCFADTIIIKKVLNVIN